MICTHELTRISSILTQDYQCILFGSLGLQMLYPQLVTSTPHDADLITIDNYDHIRLIVDFLHSQSYSIFSWQDEINEQFNYNLLKNRFYIRATKSIPDFEPIIIDITYEPTGLSFNQLYNHSFVINHTRILNHQGFIMALTQSDNPKHFSTLQSLLNL